MSTSGDTASVVTACASHSVYVAIVVPHRSP